MNSVFRKFRKGLGRLFLVLLQGGALVIGAGATPSCAYGPLDNGWDVTPEQDSRFYDGKPTDTDVGNVDDLSLPDAFDVKQTDTDVGNVDDLGATDAVEEVGLDMALYGTIPADVVDLQSADALPDTNPDTQCEPMDMYGPPPCTEDADCATYGTDYYCDKTNTINDSCGKPMDFPVCEPKPTK